MAEPNEIDWDQMDEDPETEFEQRKEELGEIAREVYEKHYEKED